MFGLLRSCLLASLFLASASLLAQEKTTSFYPLQVGTTWTYKTKDGKKFVMKVAAKDEKVGDVPCARVTITDEGKDAGHEFLSQNKDGVYRNGFGKAVPDKPVPILALHDGKLQAGDSWKIEGKALGDAFSGEFKVGKEEDVTVPAGKYKAFPVTSENLNASGLQANVTSYYTPGIGLIKQEIKIGSQLTVIELEKFEPAPAVKQ